ncbi:MAG: hypothetical protein CYPHOPRED_003667 [Cyphobasidiales sp. Tagirdzhanova-0007]|nr:MAG: hypothetical protein CYPHOPRED_003667 [Cyphobasidiales sp. Tagirdzhanova-0007]
MSGRASPRRSLHTSEDGQSHPLVEASAPSTSLAPPGLDSHASMNTKAGAELGQGEGTQPAKSSILKPYGMASMNNNSYASWDEGPPLVSTENGELDEDEEPESSDLDEERYKGGQLYSRVDDIDEDENLESNGNSDPADADVARRRRRTTRRVYGGGGGMAVDSEGDHSVLSTAWSLFSCSIAPGTPLLIPYALSLTGLSFGIPLLILLLSLGASFSHLILTVEARYVGARGYPSLAGAVFPQVYGIKWAGEILIELFTAFVSAGRALVALLISTDIVIDLFLYLFPRANVLHSRIFISLLLGLAFMIPSLLLPRRSFNSKTPFLAQLPSLSVLLYPVILLIVGVSLKNLADYPSVLKPNPHVGKPNWSSEPLRTRTLWSGVSILFFACASSHQYTFAHYRSLRRSGSTLPASSAASKPNIIERLFERHRWESATILAGVLTGLIFVGFGLVGYISLLSIHPDIFESLPRDHAWFNFSRVLVLFTTLPLLMTVIEPARMAFASLFALPRKIARPFRAKDNHHRRSSSALDLDEDEEEGHSSGGPSDRRFNSSQSRQWEARVANLTAWGIVIPLACVLHDLGGIAEILGCIGCTWFGFLLPAICFIILFHIRSPRSIFISDASSPQIQTDTLLLQKERQLQRRLMGNRLWMDLACFGLLLPVGIVGFARGVWAIASS